MTEKTTREVLAEQFAATEEEEDEPGDEAAADESAPNAEGEPAVETAGAEEDEGDESQDAKEDDGPGSEDEGDAGGERKRDPNTGKFTREKTPAQKVAEHTKAQKATEAAAAAAAAALPALKPPANWRAAAKEKWASLPREVQEESLRLNTEVSKVLNDTAQARQIAETFQRTTAPYEHLFRAQGRSAADGVGFLLQTYAQLHTAPLQQRAQLLGGFVRDFLGTDDNAINLLASALQGKAAPAGGGGGAAPITPAQIEQMVQQGVQKQQAHAAQQAEMKAIIDFEASAPEFLNDVTNEIKAIVAIEKQAGKTITVELLKAAHEKALRLNPSTASILKQRDDAASAKKKKQDDLKRKAAASSIKNEPAGPGGNGTKRPKSTKDQLASEWDKAESHDRV